MTAHRAMQLANGLRRLRGWKRFLAAFFAGAAAALAMPPLGLWPVLALSVPVLLSMLDGLEPRDWRAAVSTGWSFGFGYFAVALHWIGFAFLVDAETYLWMMPFALVGLAGSMAIYWALAAGAVIVLRLRGLALVFGFAAAIGAVEWLRGRLFTGFPWAAPGLAADGMGAVAQSASLIGMTGLTLLIMLWAGLPLAVLRPWREKIIAVALALLLPLALLWGQARLGQKPAFVPGVHLRIVQPNIAQDEKWREDNARMIFDQLKNLSSQPGIENITHLIWPESAVPFLIDESEAARAELRPLLNGRTMLITGSIRRAGEQLYNSVIVFDGEAEVAARYDKWRLVPGGEFLPFDWLLEPFGFHKVVAVPGRFAAGPGPVTFSIGGLPPFGVLICYEAIFPDDLVDRDLRPQWLVNVTNDGWFGRSSGPYQHLTQARLRAIEQGLPLARAANTGISAVIDPYGRYNEKIDLDGAGAIDALLPTALPATPYARFGDWGLLFMALSAAALAFALHDRAVLRTR